jgi:hypothetical protein
MIILPATDPMQSAAQIGRITTVRLVIFVLMKFRKALLLPKTDVSQLIPCSISLVHHRHKDGARKATIATRARIETKEVNSSL